MQEIDPLNRLIRDEELRRRVRKIVEEPKQSRWEKWSAHPITLLLLGFLLTWGVGDILTNSIKRGELETQKRLEQIKAKQESGLAAVTKISELMYERYTTASFLASSLKRKAGLEEIKQRKNLYDEAYMKWNIQLQNTQLIVRNITSDSAYSNIEAYIQYGLRPHYNMVDKHLTIGYDAALKGKDWNYSKTPIGTQLTNCLDCCYAISNYLWIRTNLYGNEQNSKSQLVKADKELARRCPKQPESTDLVNDERQVDETESEL
ncbi:hypothetical protein [Spirosoma koreense]